MSRQRWNIALVFAVVMQLVMSACRNDKHTLKNGSKPKSIQISGKDYAPGEGANSYNSNGDNQHSAYYKNPDFYSAVSDKTLIIIPHFKTMQQTTEWSCGCVCALLLLHYFDCGEEHTEWDLAVALRSMTDLNGAVDAQPGSANEYSEYGTRLEELYRYFSHHPQLKVVESSYRATYSTKDLVKSGDLFPQCDYGNLYPTFTSVAEFSGWLTTQLRAKRPVLVEWSDWDGHWVVIIGVDNNGTPDFMGDDTLIVADPYDTSDHWQDGYSIVPLERFFSLWKDRAVAPKPYQLQPYLVVDLQSR